MEVKGMNGQIEIDDNWLTIKRKGGFALVTQGLKGDKRISIATISSVQFKSATSLTNGYIQFATSSGENAGGILSAGTDENSVIFQKKHQTEFEKLRDLIESKVVARANNSGAVTNIVQSDLADQILKLSALVDQGILTQDEFQAQKQKLLGA
jgi:hypothetical protein